MVKSFFINIMPDFFVRLFARPYVSGDSIDKGIAKAEELWSNSSIYSTMDLLGEAVDSEEMVELNIQTYVELIEKLSGRSYATVSLKPTSLGIHHSYEYCEESMRRIMVEANEHSIPVTIDMEDHPYTDETLKLYHTLLKEFPNLGTVLQSRLYRTGDDIEAMSDIKGRIRICIGIYNEPKEMALQKKPPMKEKLIEYTKILLEGGHYVEFATHDINAIHHILEFVEQEGYGPDRIEFQQLLGVPMKSTQDLIKEKGYITRLYVPFATNWKYATPYLKRRLNNNPKMAWYVISQMFKKLFGRK